MFKTFIKRTIGLAVLASLFSSVPFANAQDLIIGSKAPSLDIEHWISNSHDKFKPVREFEADKVYVVEFWATWCGPCIMSMPHLKETQEKYADKGVQLISISDEETKVVDRFLERQVRGSDKDDKENTYRKLTSAYCLTTDPDKSVYEDYMDAAGQGGIPTCFIVGKSGLIEWIGHPMDMDEPLEKVVDGTWDRELHAKLVLAMQSLEKGDAEAALKAIDALSKSAKPEAKQKIEFTRCKVLLAIVVQSGKMDEQATKSLSEVSESKEISAEALNEVAWTVYEAANENDKFPKKLLAAAAVAAEKAVAKAPQNGPVLDTLAHLLYLQGNLDRAIEIQSMAVKHATPEVKEDLRSFLDELKKEKAGK